MAGGYVRKLLDPAKRMGVLRSMPIVTGDHRKNLLQAKVATNNVGANLNYLHVPDADRICYFDLRPDNNPSAFLNLHLEDVQTSATLVSGRHAKELRPCYYLPYRRNNTARMKLSPPQNYNGVEPRFFATATIDGCSVYIEGPAATPKVTHANAQAVSSTTATDTWPVKQVKIQTKITHMDTHYAFVKKGATTVVERPDYIVDDPAQVTVVKQQFAASKGIPVNLVDSYQPFGAVVGFRDGTDWKFYMQKCGMFDFRRTATGAAQSQYMVLDAREVWPNGGGTFRLLP